MINFFRRYVFNNLLLKIISLLAATLLWVAVAHDPMAEIAVNVPIEFLHVPERLEISSETIPDAQKQAGIRSRILSLSVRVRA